MRKLTNEEVIKKFKKIHGDKYDYSKVIYKNKRTKVTIICPEHGAFEMRPENHYLQHQGCKKCWDERRLGIGNLKTEGFIKKAVNKHGDLYDYSKVNYKGCRDKVIIICKNHGEFKQIPNDHLNGSGCWKCKGSKGEKLVSEILDKNNIKYETQYWFDELKSRNGRPLKFDFRLENGSIIEYDGIQHFEESSGYFKGRLPHIQKRDKIKTEYCEKKGLTLLRIPYTMDVVEIEREILKLIN